MIKRYTSLRLLSLLYFTLDTSPEPSMEVDPDSHLIKIIFLSLIPHGGRVFGFKKLSAVVTPRSAIPPDTELYYFTIKSIHKINQVEIRSSISRIYV